MAVKVCAASGPNHLEFLAVPEPLQVLGHDLSEAVEVTVFGHRHFDVECALDRSERDHLPVSQRMTVAPCSSEAGPRLAQWLASCLA